MPYTRKTPRSVERLSHLFLSDNSPSSDEELSPGPVNQPSGQLELAFESEEKEEGKRRCKQSGLTNPKQSRPPLSLLDFLPDDEGAQPY